MSSKSSQRNMTSEFMVLTGLNEKLAQKYLKAAGWKLESAADSYYASRNSSGLGKEREALLKLFEKYHDAQDEVDSLGVEGVLHYLQDIGVNLENAEIFVPLEIVQAPGLGEISKTGFVEGWKALGCDTIAKQRAHVRDQINRLSNDVVLFKRIYRHAFISSKERNQKALPLENAIIYWNLLFDHPGRHWVSASVDWLALWVEFLQKNWSKTVNKDMWNQTFEFFQKSVQDETLSFWSEDGAWPGVIDDFVAYAKAKTAPSDSMETD